MTPDLTSIIHHSSPTCGNKRVSIHEHDPHYEKEQEILVHIQELQRQLSDMQMSKQEEGSSGGSIADTQHAITSATPTTKSTKHRLIMISNRLPISVSRRNGEWSFSMSSGGLVTALNGIRDDFPFIWVGWFGQEVPKEEQDFIRQKLLNEFSCVPVFLSNQIADEYYNDFSNGILWPIFHYVRLPMSNQDSEKKLSFHSYNSYYQANREFANVVDTLYKDGDILWVHDYHLMILPSMLRESYPNCTIGWFLHTPFPSSEIYRTLPVRKEILNGLLGSDLLGFHTYDYARHFLSSCSKILGANVLPKGIEYENHFTSIGVFPIGIDPESFLNKLDHPNTKTKIQELCENFKDKKVIVGVDRLDYIKGIPHRLLAIERLLMRYPEWRGKIILVQIAVPSRTDVDEYRELGNKVNKLVGRINGTFGSLDYSPVHYVNRGVTPNELTALYNIADVCLVTSLRDGMNLVSCEFVVCQNRPCERRQGPGVLVLSEFAGSAQSLSGAIIINPWNNDDMASALNQALTLPLSEREYRQSKLYRYVTRHSASFWAKSYLTDLEDAYNRSATNKKLMRLPVNEVVNAYAESKNCLIILDYDGTLEAVKSFPHLTAPGAALRSLLETLSKDEKNTLYIVSARQTSLLKKWLGDLEIGLAAENGFFIRNPGSKEWHKMGVDFADSWRRIVHPIMQYFAERTPGSYIESKESSISWHYGDADSHFGTMQAREMQLHLEDVLCNLPLEVLQEPNVVEVRPHGINKAVVIQEAINYLSEPEDLMLKGKVDFVLCVGDSHVDDEMFSYINADLNNPDYEPLFANNPKVFTCCIGSSHTTQATYYIESSQQLRQLLAELSDHCE